MEKVSARLNKLAISATLAMTAKSRELKAQGVDVVNLSIGEPDFNTPANIVDAGISAIRRGCTRYVNSMGVYELRELAREVTFRSRGFMPDIEQILVTPGANIQLYLAIACSVNPGDEVIVPDPGFVSYVSIINYVGAKAVGVRLREENGFRLDPDEVKSAITEKTKMIILNSPSNPTGSVMGEKDVKALFDIASEKDVFLLSDEIYARMVYERDGVRFVSPGKYDACSRHTIIVNGFSKSYAMTGWRLGVVTGPSRIIEKMGLLLETILSCTSPIAQYAGIEALSGSQLMIDGMMREYRKRRDLLANGLNLIPGINCKVPDGAFYVFPSIKEFGVSSEEFAASLMLETGVVVSPGSIFGLYGEGYFRMCYANSCENISAAVDRIKEFCSKK